MFKIDFYSSSRNPMFNYVYTVMALFPSRNLYASQLAPYNEQLYPSLAFVVKYPDDIIYYTAITMEIIAEGLSDNGSW